LLPTLPWRRSIWPRKSASLARCCPACEARPA
jgi:hypothetical protein